VISSNSIAVGEGLCASVFRFERRKDTGVFGENKIFMHFFEIF
jgi:hypothetical protein